MQSVTLQKRISVLSLLVFLAGSLVISNNALAVDFDPFGSNTSDTDTRAKHVVDKGPMIPQIQFIDNEISMAFQIISDATGWSIFPTSDVGRAKVSLWAKNITALDLLDTVVSMAGFMSHRDGKIITVMTYDEYMQHYGLAKKVITPTYADAASLSSVITPFLTKLGKCVVHKETNNLVLYDTDANLTLMNRIIAKLDCPSDNIVIKVIDLQYADAEVLAKTIREIFSEQKSKDNANKGTDTTGTAKGTTKGGSNKPQERTDSVQVTTQATVAVFAIGRTNQLILKGSTSNVERAKRLIKKLDTYMEPVTQRYQFTYVDVSEVYKGLEQALNTSGRFQTGGGGKGKASVGLTLLENTNALLLTGPPSAHRIMTSIADVVDVPAPYEASVIKVYKIDNADVNEVAANVREIIEDAKKKTQHRTPAQFSAKNVSIATPKTVDTDLKTTAAFANQTEVKVSVSKSTNSIVVQATAREHRELEKLIKELDKRREQVLIKAFIVEVTTTDDLDVGIELSHLNGDKLAFTSFGLSFIDPTTGTQDVIVSPGGTVAILNPGTLQGIVQALKSDGNVKVSSSPQILVNDNAVGTIYSVDEEPITQVNASQTVATTSFAGFVDAGTQFEITPHISEQGYLRVEYNITLNSFGRRSPDPSIPPPRSTTRIKSEATVPDGSTIVVGGLQDVRDSHSVDKVPILGDIPLLGLLFRRTVVQKQYTTTYLFITSTIMKRADFNDLRDVTQEALDEIENKDNNRAKGKVFWWQK